MYVYQREKIYTDVYQDIDTRVIKPAYASLLCLLSYWPARSQNVTGFKKQCLIWFSDIT